MNCTKRAPILNVPRLSALALVLVTCAWVASPATEALADECLEEAAGTSLVCTAEDISIARIDITNLIDGCTGPNDTFEFDGDLVVVPHATERYDVAFYIGDGAQTSTDDNCVVEILDPALIGPPQDGDVCGDVNKLGNIIVPTTGIVAPCVDIDGDNFFDVSACSSWRQNSSSTDCNGPSQALPGTKSKCNCEEVNTDLPVPEPDPQCLNNADCPDDGNGCTDQVCDPAAPGADGFGCIFTNNDDPCDDGVFCNGADTCVAGSCTHAGDPCANGGICGNACNELDENCFTAGGTLCRATAGVCDTAEVCTGSSTTCPPDTFTTVECRAAAGVCDLAESCAGNSADCPADSFSTRQCRAATGVCDSPESCSGSSADCPPDGFVASAAVCRDSTGVCDPAELCDGSGACPPDSFLPSTTVCRADAGDCDVAELCTGNSGACAANGSDPDGTACTSDGDVCTDDECVAGVCEHDDNTASCDDGRFCTVGDVCVNGTCTGGGARDCGTAAPCADVFCDEVEDTCGVIANDAECDDGNACTADLCSPTGGCVTSQLCDGTDICRTAGFWSNHSGLEAKSSKIAAINVTQDLLDQVGPLDVCGQTISTTGTGGLSDVLEALCVSVQGESIRQLFRQLVTAALNCAVSGSPADCDLIVNDHIDVTFGDCSALCAGTPVVDGPTIGECIDQIDCFNNGGEVIGGTCALGTCADQPEIECGDDSGDCPLFGGLPQECVPFDINCHDNELCNENINFCPDSSPASSTTACKAARDNDCTIDSCN